MDLVSLIWPALVFVGVALGAAAVRARYLTPQGKIRGAMRRVPRAPIVAGVDAGRRRFVGRVVADGPSLRSPLTGRSCVAYAVAVEQRGPATGPTEASRRLYDDSREVDFILDDGSARALVVVDRCEMVLVPRTVTGTLETLPAGLREILLDRGVSRRQLSLLGRKAVAREGALVVGERAAVVGVTERVGDVEGRGGEEHRLVAAADSPLLVSNDPSACR